MAQSPPALALVLGSLPAVAALLKVVWPTGERALHQRVRRLAEIAGLLPEGEAREAVEQQVGLLAQELAFRESARARRRLEGPTVAAVVVVALVFGSITVVLWRTESPWLRGVALLLAAFGAALMFTGILQARPVAKGFRFQDPETIDSKQSRSKSTRSKPNG
ncbi:hypothetical protein ET495_06160 [Xylanimonas allomyrinae]|uniref:Uncharacterized protein n=1 Tax=Xylanimonas allomyrinae TaxID=2509459 RepID=A0A4P6ERA7_9MICO|nr:hypothetical protein [Xylanimonas allomyrinae]QAY62897.1 hypothetical protein ET495_06160 [Xylanimonas allomyrinae]